MLDKQDRQPFLCSSNALTAFFSWLGGGGGLSCVLTGVSRRRPFQHLPAKELSNARCFLRLPYSKTERDRMCGDACYVTTLTLKFSNLCRDVKVIMFCKTDSAESSLQHVVVVALQPPIFTLPVCFQQWSALVVGYNGAITNATKAARPRQTTTGMLTHASATRPLVCNWPVSRLSTILIHFLSLPLSVCVLHYTQALSYISHPWPYMSYVSNRLPYSLGWSHC